MAHSTASLRKFLLEAFGDEDVNTFCFDYFPRLQDQFTVGMTKGQKIQLLIEYCQRHDFTSNLEAALQKERPDQYARVFSETSRTTGLESTPIARNPKQIFISHAHQDADLAHRLAGDLKNRGWSVWIAPESIRPGEKWVSAIDRALEESGVFLAVLTLAARKSSWMKSETYSAIQIGHHGLMRLIPLLAEPCEVSPLLGGYQQVSFLGPYEDGLASLLQELDRQSAEDDPVPHTNKPSGIPGNERGQKSLTVPIIVAMLGVAGAIGAAIIGYLGPIRSAQTMIEAAQTAESRLAQITVVPTPRVIPQTTSTLVAQLLPSATHEVRPPSTPLPALASASDDLVLTLTQGVEMVFVRVPAGEFTMGSDPAKDQNTQMQEQPQHSVDLSEFYIGKYEVTVGQFAAFVEATGYTTTAETEGWGFVLPREEWSTQNGANWRHPHGPESVVDQKAGHPVTQITWYDAEEFCRWMSKITGRRVRLPTEAEWEKAARGTDGRIFPWGDAWDTGKLNGGGSHVMDTTPIGHYSPDGDSPYGAADMVGNVSEWTSTLYDDKEYQYQTQSGSLIKDPIGPRTGSYRVARSGSWVSEPAITRVAYRNKVTPDIRDDGFGFRVVVSP